MAATEPRWVALPVGHPLLAHPGVPFAQLAAEPFVALPDSSGPMREFWLAVDQRTTPVRIGAVATTADEAFEAVASGLGVVLLAAGNAAIYRRDDVECRPVPDLPPCELAVLWRRGDRRTAVRVVTDACCRCVAAEHAGRCRRHLTTGRRQVLETGYQSRHDDLRLFPVLRGVRPAGARPAGPAGRTSRLRRLWISDHFHPWNDEQGQSPFVWSVIGALSEAVSLPVTTAVTCPTIRIHPAIIAQAAATAAVQLDGRFVLGVGSGEALNEHILGDPWPSAGVRLDMLEEAVEVIRLLHRARRSASTAHYEVQDARIYTLPEQPVPIYVSGFGPQADRAGRPDRRRLLHTMPDAELRKLYRDGGGGKPVQGGMKVLGRRDGTRGSRRAPAVGQRTAARPARSGPAPPAGLRGCGVAGPRDARSADRAGRTSAAHRAAQEYVDAGFDEVYVQQIGPDFDGFFTAYK